MPSHQTRNRDAGETEPRALAVAQRAAVRLAAVDGVVGVTLGGSWARGTAGPGSDVDLGVYYRATRHPSIARLRRLAAELDDRHAGDLLTDFGGWGRWIDGGGWLRIDGQAVDWLYRDLDRVERELDGGV
jgi:predicted nucleotidyltransferase